MKIASRTPVIVAGAALAAAAGVLAIGVALSQSASAATPSPSARPSGAPSGWVPGGPEGAGERGAPGGRGGPGGLGGLGGPGGPRGQLLHGEEVVQQGTKVVTIDEQAGKVTAVSATSITVKSSDGFTATYVVGFSTLVAKSGAQAKISAVKVADTVRIEGTRSGSTVTATRLMDGLPANRPDGPQAPRPPAGASAAPSPGGTA